MTNGARVGKRARPTRGPKQTIRHSTWVAIDLDHPAAWHPEVGQCRRGWLDE